MTYLTTSDALSGPVSGLPSGARAAWIAAAKKKGATVTRMPSGPNAGKLCARYGTKKPYRYVLASPAALAEDARESQSDTQAVKAGRQVERAERALTPTTQAGWTAEVKRRGGAVTRMPTGVMRGKLAARFGAKPPYRYELAPASVIAADAVDNVTNAGSMALGHAVETRDVVKAVVVDTAKDALAVPRKALAELLGIPPWMVPALAIGAGALVLTRVLPAPAGAGRGR